MVTELKFAVRSALRRPAVSLLVVLMIALGVAASSAVFTLIDGLLLRPLPWPDSGRLVYLNETAPRWNLEFTYINYPDFAIWRSGARSFEAMALHSRASFNVGSGDRVSRIEGATITHEFLDVLQVQPVLGRPFTPEEDAPGGPRVVAISEALWQTQFGGALDVIGRTLRLDSEARTIVAVYPRAAAYPTASDVWVPLAESPVSEGQSYSYEGVARLRPGVSIQAAREDLLRAHAPTWERHDTDRTVSPVVLPLREHHVGDLRPMMLALMGAGALVLLIACANVASVMLARAVSAQREVGVRSAIGAPARRLAWQQIAESLVLAVAGAALGIVVGLWCTSLLLAGLPREAPPWLEFGPSARVIGFVVAATVGAALLAGIAPMLQALRMSQSSALSAAAGVRTTASAGQRRLLKSCVVFEIALATVLLVCGGLLLRAFDRLQQVDPGFRVENVLRFQVILPEATYDGEPALVFHRTLLDNLRRLPGVRSAGFVTCLPLTCHQGNFFEAQNGRPRDANEQNPVVLTLASSPGYAEAAGIRMLRGSYFNAAQFSQPDGVAVVNESFVRQFWPPEVDPIGQRVRFSGDDEARWIDVVGVAQDMRHYGLEEDARPTIILPATLQPRLGYGYALHTEVTPISLVDEVRSAVRGLDPELPLFRVETAHDALAASLDARRTYSWVLSVAAVAALVLALGGIYGVLSYVMGQRTHELGVRLALGARPVQIARLVIEQGAVLTGVGVALGTVGALFAARALAALLYGVSPGDPLTYGVVVVVLCAAGLAAVLGPARRAARTNPQRVLRQ